MMATRNQTPEQKARDNIDGMLEQAGWKVQDRKKLDFKAGPGIAVREYPTDAGPADYVLFVGDRQAVGVIEAKPEYWGQKITTAEGQSQGYAAAEQLLARIQKERKCTLLKLAAYGDAEVKRYLNKISKNTAQHPAVDLPFGTIWVNFLEFCTFVVDCHNKTAPYQKRGVHLIRTPCIRNGKIHLNEEARFVSKETYEYWARRCPPESGDIIFTREAPMGEACIVPPGKKLCMGQRMMLLRPPG